MIKVYQYGCLAPKSVPQQAEIQLQLSAVRSKFVKGEGSWTVRIQTLTANEEEGGQSIEPVLLTDLFDKQSRISHLVQVDPVDFSDWSNVPRGERRIRARTTIRMRVGLDGRESVWLELPVVMDRPIPCDASIKQVQITRRRIRRLFRYWVSFTVEEPDTHSTSAVNF